LSIYFGKNNSQGAYPNFYDVDGEIIDIDNVSNLQNVLNTKASYQKMIGDYGSDWSGVSLPSASAVDFVLAINTNGTGSSRLYVSNGTAFKYVVLS